MITADAKHNAKLRHPQLAADWEVMGGGRLDRLQAGSPVDRYVGVAPDPYSK